MRIRWRFLVVFVVVSAAQAVTAPAFAPLESRDLYMTATVSMPTSPPTPVTISENAGGKEAVETTGLVLSGEVDCEGTEQCLSAGLHEAPLTVEVAMLELTRRDRSSNIRGSIHATISVGPRTMWLRARARGAAACAAEGCTVDLRIDGVLYGAGGRRIGAAVMGLSGDLSVSGAGPAWTSLEGDSAFSITGP